jgi:NADH-quinone oxidoreductase subunit D
VSPSAEKTAQPELTSWVLGPYHGSLPGPLRMAIDLDGERMFSVRIQRGFLHRGLEKCLENRGWLEAIVYADRLDPEAAVFGETAFCLAAEEIGEIPVPPRGQAIRMVLGELTRISCHLASIARLALAIGAETMAHYALRDREKILDLFELLTGARFSIGFLRLGGVCADVTEGFIERALDVCELLGFRLKEYNDLFSFNQAFLKRSVGVGVLGKQVASRFGVTGPNARASGLAFDVRKNHPYSGYQRVDFEVPVSNGDAGSPGDSHDRYLVRLREIAQSLGILKHLNTTIPSGEFRSTRMDLGFRLPKGEAYSRVESHRGMLGCHIVSDGSEKPYRVAFRAPSVAALDLVPEVLRGQRAEDLPVILASLDLGVAEADR